MKKLRLKKEILEKLKERNNISVRNKLALRMLKSAQTIENWIYINSIMLTTADILDELSNEFDISKDNLLEEIYQ